MNNMKNQTNLDLINESEKTESAVTVKRSHRPVNKTRYEEVNTHKQRSDESPIRKNRPYDVFIIT